jgi:hypothetical protein
MSIFSPGVTSDAYSPDQLIAGDFPCMTRSVTLLSGQNLLRGRNVSTIMRRADFGIRLG